MCVSWKVEIELLRAAMLMPFQTPMLHVVTTISTLLQFVYLARGTHSFPCHALFAIFTAISFKRKINFHECCSHLFLLRVHYVFCLSFSCLKNDNKNSIVCWVIKSLSFLSIRHSSAHKWSLRQFLKSRVNLQKRSEQTWQWSTKRSSGQRKEYKRNNKNQ